MRISVLRIRQFGSDGLIVGARWHIDSTLRFRAHALQGRPNPRAECTERGINRRCRHRKRTAAVGRTSALHPLLPISALYRMDRSRPRLCENSRVQFARRKFFSIWSICKPKLLTTAIRGRQKINRFYALLAHAPFHAAWTQSGRSCRPTSTGPVAPTAAIARIRFWRLVRMESGHSH